MIDTRNILICEFDHFIQIHFVSTLLYIYCLIFEMQNKTLTEHKLGIPELSEEEMVLEIAERIKCARLWCQRYWQLLCDPDLHCQAKFQLYKFFVRPILTYGCEVWTLDDRSSKKLLRFECATLLEIYKSKYPHRHPKRLRPNMRAVYKRYRDTDIVDHVRNERMNWKKLLRIEERALGRRSKKSNKRVHWWDKPPPSSNIACKHPSTASNHNKESLVMRSSFYRTCIKIQDPSEPPG